MHSQVQVLILIHGKSVDFPVIIYHHLDSNFYDAELVLV